MPDTQKHTNLRVLVPIAIALFLLSCAVRVWLADYPKGIGVLPDEIRYLNLASSLFNHGELVQRGGISSFQKILYPLSLAPAFLFDDPQARVRAITMLNCIYVSSAVFPALVLARRLFNNKAPIIICMVFTLIVPDMCYSMTFLTESVYLPVALWLIACCLVALESSGKRRYFWCAGAGLLCYLVYLCKEVALGFALAFLVLMIIHLVKDNTARKNTAIGLACFIAGLAIPFFIMKLTLFHGLLNSYNQADPSVFLNPYTLLFALYAFLSDAVHFTIAFMFFPLVFPAFTWKRLTPKEREFYLFCLLSFAFILLAVIYTISIREDLGHTGIRPHVRYVSAIFLPLLFLFIKQVVRGDGIAIMRSPVTFVIAISSTICMVLFTLFLLGTADYAQGFDYSQFHWVRVLRDTMPSIPVEPGGNPSALPADDIYHGTLFEINTGLWLAKFVFCLFLGFGAWALASKDRVQMGMALIIMIGVFMLANNACAYQYNSSVYKVEQDDVDQICMIEDFVDKIPEGEQVLFVIDDESSSANNLMDVYVDNNRYNISYIKKTEFKEHVAAGNGTQKKLLIEADSTMGDNIYAANGRKNDEKKPISYIITNVSQNLRLSTTCAQDLSPSGLDNFFIYKVFPGATIELQPSKIIGD